MSRGQAVMPSNGSSGPLLQRTGGQWSQLWYTAEVLHIAGSILTEK